MSEARVIELHYRIEPGTERALAAWVLPEVPVPESQPHDRMLDYLKALLLAWVARTSRNAVVARNLAVRWLKRHPQVGIDPDLCVLEPAPPRAAELESLCTWRPGHSTPRLCVEVVSRNHPYKDYGEVHERYAACGVEELWVLDPRRLGPKKLGGPVPVQIWRREPTGAFVRVHHGAGPARSEVLDAWVHSQGATVRIADDEAGLSPWLTQEEAERAAKDAALADKEAALAAQQAERAEKEAERARRIALERQLEEHARREK
ncbi:MAG: Uma2 family endonuclease [Myxococcales bacterium]|nr:Uma2 family endonuclease [Myxococcales bacterium]